jgi:hypothetical protein
MQIKGETGMSNKRIVNGEETPSRIERVWKEIIERNEYPTVVEFSRKAAISSTTLYHLYGDYAEKIRARRDRKFGKKKRSPVTYPKITSRSMEKALKQIEELQRALSTKTKELSEIINERNHLNNKLYALQNAEVENEKWRGLMLTLHEKLGIAGVQEYVIERLWRVIESNIVSIQNG